MAWIEVHQTVFGHRKTRKVSLLLGIPCVHVAGHLISFWCWALDKTQDGTLPGTTEQDIADAAEYDGDAASFTHALRDAHYLDTTETGDYCIHDWADYTSRLMVKRNVNAERQKRYRERLKQHNEALPVTNVTIDRNDVTRNAIPTNQPTNQPILLHNSDELRDGVDDDSLMLSLPDDTKQKDYSAEFERWWKSYPRKIGKGRSYKLWVAWKKRIGVDCLLTAAQNYALECEGREESKIKHPSTFLATDNTLPEEYAGKAVQRQGRFAATDTYHGRFDDDPVNPADWVPSDEELDRMAAEERAAAQGGR